MDFSNRTLCGKNFSNQDLTGADFSNSNLDGSDFLNSNLSFANFSGANLHGCRLEGANIKNIITDSKTQFFRMRCPETGAFLGYKKCYDNRMVRLLIPSDAKRTSATLNSCRCDKAFVLSVDSLDGKIKYDYATSFVDDSFCYKTGTYAYASSFNDDRWVESTAGIHFFMTREEAIGYL